MSKFVLFKRNGYDVLVNVDLVRYITPHDVMNNASIIHFEGEKLGVTEDYQSVVEKLTSL